MGLPRAQGSFHFIWLFPGTLEILACCLEYQQLGTKQHEVSEMCLVFQRLFLTHAYTGAIQPKPNNV